MVSVDSIEDSRRVVEKSHLPYAILSDPNLEVIKSFGVVHEKGSPESKDIAIPSHFVISKDGHIRWRHIAERVQDRPDPQNGIAALKKL